MTVKDKNYISAWNVYRFGIREPEIIAKQIICHLKIFPIYLLGASNTMIGKIVSNAFEVIAPPGHITLFWVHELQLSEAVLQNMLVTNRGAVAYNLVAAMKHPLTDFDNFATINLNSLEPMGQSLRDAS